MYDNNNKTINGNNVCVCMNQMDICAEFFLSKAQSCRFEIKLNGMCVCVCQISLMQCAHKRIDAMLQIVFSLLDDALLRYVCESIIWYVHHKINVVKYATITWTIAI